MYPIYPRKMMGDIVRLKDFAVWLRSFENKLSNFHRAYELRGDMLAG
jgi:hypothetical protein